MKLFLPLTFFFQFSLSIIFLCTAIFFCKKAAIQLGQKDPGVIILDECVAMPIVFLGLYRAMSIYSTWFVLVTGFVVFRLFDVFKPLIINSLQKLPGGLGIVMDDVAAALFSCFCLHLIILALDFI